MGPVKLFVSHTSPYSNLAKSLRMSLQALQPNELLDVEINEEIQGGIEWRKWIEETTRTADAFVLLYPHEDMDMSWPNFEVARFFGREVDREKRVVWIRNPGLKKWPAVFEPYQAYEATPEGIFKFFTQTFVSGILTGGEPLNPDIGVLTNPYYELARTAARELAEQFAEASIRPQFHVRRIQITLAYDKGRLNPERSKVEGNAEGMKMIGMGAEADVNWTNVRNTVNESVSWPLELEREITLFATGALPPCLSPFSSDDGIYIPVVTKSETLQSRLHRISVIFVEADIGKLRSMLDWSMPAAMPGQVAAFVRIVRLMLRVRYDILEPRYQEAKFDAPDRERRIAICNEVLAEYKAVNEESVKVGMKGLEAFYMIFDLSLREKLDEASTAHIEAIRALKQYLKKMEAGDAPDTDDDMELCALLKSLRTNNAHWLEIAGEQFEKFVGMWQ